MVDDVLVDRCARRDQDGHARLLAATGAPELLPCRGDRARIACEDRCIEPADVDSQLERVGRDHAEDLAVAEAALDRPPLRRQVAAAVAADPGARAATLAQQFAQAGQKQLHRDARAPEHDRLATCPQEWQGPSLGEVHRRAARPALRVKDRRIDEQDVPLPGGRTGPVDDPAGPAGEHRGELARVPDRRRAADDDRRAAVMRADPQQPAEHVGDVAPENAPVRMELVDDDDAELLEQLEPLGVMRQDRRVEHVRVGHDHLPGGPDRRPDRSRRVTVVGRGRDRQARGRGKLAELGHLVLSERLGREQEQGPCRRVLGDRLEDRQGVAQRLA